MTSLSLVLLSALLSPERFAMLPFRFPSQRPWCGLSAGEGCVHIAHAPRARSRAEEGPEPCPRPLTGGTGPRASEALAISLINVEQLVGANRDLLCPAQPGKLLKAGSVLRNSATSWCPARTAGAGAPGVDLVGWGDRVTAPLQGPRERAGPFCLQLASESPRGQTLAKSGLT